MRECSSASQQQKFLPELRCVNGRTASITPPFVLALAFRFLAAKGESVRHEVTEQSLGPKVFGSTVVFWTQFLYPNEMAGGRPLSVPMSYASNALCGRAFHEAGYAVVARYFGLTVVGIEIRDDASGKTDTVGPVDDLPLIDRIAIHCAGEASRTVFKCRIQNRALDEPAELRELLEGLTEDHRLEVRNAGFRRAIEIVKSNAPEVERLANLLIERRRIGESGIA
jgi:hypothetical protein